MHEAVNAGISINLCVYPAICTNTSMFIVCVCVCVGGGNDEQPCLSKTATIVVSNCGCPSGKTNVILYHK